MNRSASRSAGVPASRERSYPAENASTPAPRRITARERSPCESSDSASAIRSSGSSAFRRSGLLSVSVRTSCSPHSTRSESVIQERDHRARELAWFLDRDRVACVGNYFELAAFDPGPDDLGRLRRAVAVALGGDDQRRRVNAVELGVER